MKYFARLSHLPVIEKESGRKLGTLSDIYIEKKNGRIFAIQTTNENILYRNRLVYASDILEETPSKIYVRGFGERFLSVPPIPKEQVVSYRNAVYNKRVLRENGEILGKIKDCSFDFETGKMEEIELGKGLSDDLLYGRNRLSLDGEISVYRTNVIVDEKGKLIHSDKGIKKIMKG